MGASANDSTSSSLTAVQLYSTASYQALDLHGIGLSGLDMTGWDLANQRLTGADFTGATLKNANLTNAQLASALFSGANLSDADLRGSTGASLTSATTHNTILPDGSINGLTLAAGESLVIRNYAGAESVPIIVLGQMSMDPAASLQIVLDGQPWGSTISFDSGIPVSLAGELDLTFAPGIDPTSLVGDTFQLFDWSGVNPNGRFQVVSNYGSGHLSDL